MGMKVFEHGSFFCRIPTFAILTMLKKLVLPSVKSSFQGTSFFREIIQSDNLVILRPQAAASGAFGQLLL